jgi:hypothetical protein
VLGADGRALEPPDQAACAVAARHVKQIAGRPAELDRQASPLGEEPAGVIKGLPPLLNRDVYRLLALQPRPSIEVGFSSCASSGSGGAATSPTTPRNFAIWDLIVSHT